MRIAILSDGVHPYVIGGMQRHTYYLVKYLSRAGIKVTLFHYNNSEKDIHLLEVFSEEERSNIESIVLEFPKGDRFPGHYVRASHKYSERIYDKIKDRLNEFDFIYSKGFSAWKLIEEKKKGNKEIPPIGVKFHGYEMFQMQANFKSRLGAMVLRGPVKWITQNANFVFSYGAKITDIIRSLGVKNEKIIEIPAGIEKEWLRTDIPETSGIRKFIFLGRYERRKGVEELNQAIRKLIQSGERFSFEFIGPFELDMQVKSDSVVYHGTITDNLQLRYILDNSHVLVCPSWSEGMPNVILEGMARGNAILATDVGANSIMVAEDNGLFVKTGDVEDLYQNLKRLIHTDDTKIGQMRMNSISKIENKLLYNKIIDMFVGIIKNKINK
ncbi:MAG TPA: glycosyltransferase family 4 protein [Bacteroidia bacterium]